MLPKIIGKTIRKENRVAFSRSIPNRTAEETVAPLLEIPGRIAMACTRPNINELEKDTLFLNFAIEVLSHQIDRLIENRD